MTIERELGVLPKGWKLVRQAVKKCSSYDPTKVCLAIEEIIISRNSKVYDAYKNAATTGLAKYSDVVRIVEALKEAG